ncbi:uncharacterized protein LOC125498529 [Beta vulgaris subsp. vulgaris]|uniref:uncharacterized protein LOC125498529 n=1 Tax=Beta vulgaris subsp. vulgaris TaxID=3555 RepID=UPI00203666B5|nr:uncharacterized protein LOC125498529 [Beta vulgaris subsp. vulgaris]
MGLSSLQKCTAAIRMLAYGMSADAVDEYLRLGRTNARTTLLKFTEGVIACFGEKYLRRPTNTNLERLLGQGERRGFAGMIGSIDCSCNDLNVLYRSPIFDDVLHWRAPGVNFMVNGQHYSMGYYLTDGIYPQWAAFIQGFSLPQTDKQRVFADRQAAVHKDVEFAFGVLQARFAIIRKLSLARDEDILNNIMFACIIMHNMIVEDEGESYIQYADTREFIKDRPRNRGSASATTSVEAPFEYANERPFNMDQYLARRAAIRDKPTHISLKSDLIEHIWQRYGRNNEQQSKYLDYLR